MKKLFTRNRLIIFCWVLFGIHGQAAILTANTSNFTTQYAATANGDVVLLDAGTYTSAITFPAGKSVTIKGNPNASSMPVLNFALADANNATGSLTFDGVMIDRNVSGTNQDYFYNSASTNLNISLLKFQNCKIQNIKKALINTSSQTGNITNITIDNCIITGCGTSQTSFIYVSQVLGTFSVSNSTIYNYVGGDFFHPNNASTTNTISLSYTKNTMYHCIWDNGYGWASINGKYPSASTYYFTDNIFDTGANGPGNKPIFVYKGGQQYEQKNVKLNYGSSGNQSGGSLVQNANLGTTALTYTDAANGNFKITSVSPTLDLSTAGNTGGIVGDPRWFQTSAITPGSSTISGIDYNLNTSTATVKSFSLAVTLPGSQITLTAPSDFEISTSAGSGFGSSLTLGTQWFNLSTIIYVRMKSGLSAGSYNSEAISISAMINGSTSTQNVSCSGSVTSASPLSSPDGLTASSVSFTGFHASWNSVPNATSYTVNIYQNGSLVTNVATSATYADITGLTQGATYTFKVIAIGDGSSYSSSLESATSSAFTTLVLNLYTSINTVGAGAVTKGQSVPYNLNQTVSLTATKNFGYQFVNWVDSITGIALSSANPYTVTLDGTKHIQAVFNTLSTYNFTVNKAGVGAYWGNVVVSPSQTGGKEESGASVTMTPVSNIVSTFSQWDDASTGAKTVTVSGDATYTATFNANPFIVAWDFPTTSNVQNRPSDYYCNASNQGVMRLFKTDGVNELWTFNYYSGKNAMRRWTSYADIVTNKKCRYYQAEFSTKGYKNILVASKITFDNFCVNSIQKMQYSTDGVNFTDVNSYTFLQGDRYNWCALNGALPAGADNASIVYIRWIGDVNSATVPGGTPGTGDTEGFFLTDILVSGTQLVSSAASGDYIATTSGDISNPANWNVSGGSFGISGNPGSAPTSSTNLVIPVGITMTNSAAANCNNMQVQGAYTASAALAVAGNLTIQSDASGTGTILDNGNMTITGTVTTNQYLTSGRNWYVSSPVGGATVGSLSSATQVVYYDEPTASWLTATGTLAALRGYLSVATASTGNITYSGTLNTGSKSITLTRTDGVSKSGFNLVGNPYPSYLDWDKVSTANTDVMTTMWYRTQNSSNTYVFDTYNSTGGVVASTGVNQVTKLIPPGQAFWVRLNSNVASTNFSVDNTMRTHRDFSGNLMKVKQNVTSNQLLRLDVSNGVNADETVIYFNPNASDGADDYDSPKMSNANKQIPEIFTLVGGNEMVINGLNAGMTTSELPIGFRSGHQTSYSITAKEMTNLGDVRVILHDNQLNTQQDLTEGASYSFASDSLTTTTSRFTVEFKTPGVATALNNPSGSNVAINTLENKIQVNCSTGLIGSARVNVYNAIGQLVYSNHITNPLYTIEQNFVAGIYTVRVNTLLGVSSAKVILK